MEFPKSTARKTHHKKTQQHNSLSESTLRKALGGERARMAAVRAQLLFGQTETLKHSMDEGFRRFDILGNRAQRAFKATSDNTLRAAIASSQSASAAPPPPPKLWREAWLNKEPTLEELLLATHGPTEPVDANKTALNLQRRRLWRSTCSLRRPPPRAPAAPSASGTPPAATASTRCGQRTSTSDSPARAESAASAPVVIAQENRTVPEAHVNASQPPPRPPSRSRPSQSRLEKQRLI